MNIFAIIRHCALFQLLSVALQTWVSQDLESVFASKASGVMFFLFVQLAFFNLLDKSSIAPQASGIYYFRARRRCFVVSHLRGWFPYLNRHGSDECFELIAATLDPNTDIHTDIHTSDPDPDIHSKPGRSVFFSLCPMITETKWHDIWCQHAFSCCVECHKIRYAEHFGQDSSRESLFCPLVGLRSSSS